VVCGTGHHDFAQARHVPGSTCFVDPGTTFLSDLYP